MAAFGELPIRLLPVEEVDGAAEERRIRAEAMLKLSRRKGWLNFMICLLFMSLVECVCASE